ncbi:putative F-box/FBD/LRR-repeat protein At5g22670 [Lotus japonicus]|uniref:putative F-box/FBD/LRR-repeat protein At5g22670 n=1 Tax=Lotus japonicus TaxID=34305 RepID=UPI002587F4B8|nr:putative F-box/FBD/LRR-repeat protein At5g22670 [Lotus japonicus]
MADRISMLPDDVICNILSFLPTQDVVSTSLLSKRWKPLWRSVPSLYFDDQSYLINNNSYSYVCFQKFICNTMLARNANEPIQLPSKVSLLKLRSCIFSCETLVVLKLVGLDVDVFSSVDLPKLKSMYLNDIGFPEEKNLVELLSGCPILENLEVYYLFFNGVSSTPTSNKNVKRLSKLVRADIYCIAFDIPLKAICNVEFLRIDKLLLYPDGIPVFPNLTHLELKFGSDMNWHLVLRIIKKSPKLQTFVLNMEASAADMIWIPTYAVPNCLSSLRICSITSFEGTESELHFVKYILQNSGVLRAMTIRTRPSLRLEWKYEMLQELSLCSRSSTSCELSFE